MISTMTVGRRRSGVPGARAFRNTSWKRSSSQSSSRFCLANSLFFGTVKRRVISENASFLESVLPLQAASRICGRKVEDRHDVPSGMIGRAATACVFLRASTNHKRFRSSTRRDARKKTQPHSDATAAIASYATNEPQYTTRSLELMLHACTLQRRVQYVYVTTCKHAHAHAHATCKCNIQMHVTCTCTCTCACTCACACKCNGASAEVRADSPSIDKII